MNNFEVINTLEEQIDLSEIKNVLEYALKVEKINNAVFNVIITNNDEIHKLNKTYRNIDRPTDVLSFALEENDDIPLENIRFLGDIYISLDKAKEQSREYNHSLLRELAFLSVHGLLHLLGYDHMNKDDEKVMFSLQERILSEYGISR